MALQDLAWYVNGGDGSTTGYYAVGIWVTGAVYVCGSLVRPTAPTTGNERVFVCYAQSGVSGGSEPAWVNTRGAQTTDNLVKWQEVTGCPALNNDLSVASQNRWSIFKNAGVTLGQVVISGDGTKVLLCIKAGTAGSIEPAWASYNSLGDPGGTTVDGTVQWVTVANSTTNPPTLGACPHARLANALASTWYSPGDFVYVADNHAESQTTAITMTPQNTTNTYGKVLCYDHTITSLPPASNNLTTGASVSTTSSANIAVNGGSLYWYGLLFKTGVGLSSGSSANVLLTPTGGCEQIFDHCQFWLANTGNNTSLIGIGASGGTASVTVTWKNCLVKFGATAQHISPGTGSFYWQNGATSGSALVSGSAVASTFISVGVQSIATFCNVTLEALDLSSLSGTVLCDDNVNAQAGFVIFKDCKLPASYSAPSNLVGPNNYLQLIRSDNSSSNIFFTSRYSSNAAETTETSIARTGGATDPSGNAQSRKIATTATCGWVNPHKMEELQTFNSGVDAPITLTVCGTTNAASVPLDDEIWMEVEYLGTSSALTGVVATTTKANVLATGLAVLGDTSAWGGGGSGSGWSPFKLTISLDGINNPLVRFAGMISVRVRAGKASTTYYIDPKIQLTS